ncbi:mannitol dehydrogenase family protein [Granulicella arctica]|uniref:mannitol dehydrogenase family protein n=1 Tax=Granulicella arctica TaxID=940613 RepID=UPI0021E05122|nr:mannitol dehydrogenase family protein [Granulicella arctica]
MPELSIKLTTANLSRLSAEVQTPAYDRRELIPHTIHIGVGGFHRAHQALYLDDLLAMKDTERWGECGLGVLKSDDRMRDVLASQDHLYTLVERSADTQSARVIGSLVDYIYAPEAREAAIEKMSAVETRIVSLTITEGGYFIDEGTGGFLVNHPAIQHDLQNPTEPKSSIGLIAEALDRRRVRGLAPFTVMSCDNLQGNGHVISKVLSAYASLSNPALEAWITANVAFPNSMVDRITPATTPADIEWVGSRFGIDDAWPVVTEPFLQWVIEDTFSNGRPQWERVGAQFTTDVASYEIMKMRLLNGSHLAMAYLGALAGYTYVQDIMADPLFVTFIERFMEEVTPVVPIIPNTSISGYKKSLIERFSNPTINDQVTRICSEGSAKIPKWLLPSIQELLDRDLSVDLLSLVVASWIFYFGEGVDQSGKPLDIVDVRADELTRIAQPAGTNPLPMLAVQSIFGERLFANETFRQKTAEALRMLSNEGVTATIKRYLAP